MKNYSDYNGTPVMKLGTQPPKFPIGSYAVWYNDIIGGEDMLSNPYKVLDFVWQYSGKHYEYCYVIQGVDIDGEEERTEIYESGLYPSKYMLRKEKFKRILK